MDNGTVEDVCMVDKVAEVHAGSVNFFVSKLHELRLEFSDTKNVVSASTEALARAAVQSFQGLTVRDAARVTSLGSCLGAGVRRNMLRLERGSERLWQDAVALKS